jgi:hypothetical protein
MKIFPALSYSCITLEAGNTQGHHTHTATEEKITDSSFMQKGFNSQVVLFRFGINLVVRIQNKIICSFSMFM